MSYFGGKLGRPRRRPVLVDVDGVIADFCGKVSEYIEDRFDIEIDRSKIYSDVREEADGLWDDSCEAYIRSEGFAQTLDELPGGVEGVKKIMKERDVVFVTSPYDSSPTWCFDRFAWLKERFDITRDDIIFARDKRFIDGITLIDDRFENVVDWSIYNERCSILKKTSQNEADLNKSEFVGGSFYTYEQHGAGYTFATFFALDSWDRIAAYIGSFEKEEDL